MLYDDLQPSSPSKAPSNGPWPSTSWCIYGVGGGAYHVSATIPQNTAALHRISLLPAGQSCVPWSGNLFWSGSTSFGYRRRGHNLASHACLLGTLFYIVIKLSNVFNIKARRNFITMITTRNIVNFTLVVGHESGDGVAHWRKNSQLGQRIGLR